MLKSLFESSIDKLNIPADMKSAIKKINNICLEAEETSDNVKKSVEKVSKNQGMFNQHVSAEQAKAMYDAQQKENAAKSGGKPQTQASRQHSQQRILSSRPKPQKVVNSRNRTMLSQRPLISRREQMWLQSSSSSKLPNHRPTLYVTAF